MKKNQFVFPAVVLISLLLLSNCSKKPDIKFVELNLAEIDTTTIDNSDPLAAKNVRGYAARYWGRVMNHCIQSLLLKGKDADYLGPSNLLDLGTITDKRLDLTYRILDSNVFSKDELKKIIRYGAPTTCAYEISSNINIESLMNARIGIKADDDLSLDLGNVIKNSKNVSYNVSSWQKDEIIVGNLMDALRDTESPKKKGFKEDLLKEGRLIMTSAIRVKGFSADIELNNDISSYLKAKLSPGVVANLGNADATVKVSVVNSKVIRLQSTDDFIVYGKFSIAQKL
jgi:hypothetical protein